MTSSQRKGEREGQRGEKLGWGEWRDYTDRSGLLCVCPGKAILALTRLHKHVQYLTPAQFPPYINMGGDSCAFTKTTKTNSPNLHEIKRVYPSV